MLVLLRSERCAFHKVELKQLPIEHCTRLYNTTYLTTKQATGGVCLDFRVWESCRTTPLVGGFSRGSPVFRAPFMPTLLHAYLTSPSLALETSMLRASQISSLYSTPLDGTLPNYLHSVDIRKSWKGTLEVRDWLTGVTWSRGRQPKIFADGSSHAAPILADQQARPADVRRGARQTHPRRSEDGSSDKDKLVRRNPTWWNSLRKNAFLLGRDKSLHQSFPPCPICPPSLLPPYPHCSLRRLINARRPASKSSVSVDWKSTGCSRMGNGDDVSIPALVPTATRIMLTLYLLLHVGLGTPLSKGSYLAVQTIPCTMCDVIIRCVGTHHTSFVYDIPSTPAARGLEAKVRITSRNNHQISLNILLRLAPARVAKRRAVARRRATSVSRAVVLIARSVKGVYKLGAMAALGAILPVAAGGSARGLLDERTAARGPRSAPDEPAVERDSTESPPVQRKGAGSRRAVVISLESRRDRLARPTLLNLPVENASRGEMISHSRLHPTFKFRARLEIEMKFVSSRRNWRFEISIRDQQPSTCHYCQITAGRIIRRRRRHDIGERDYWKDVCPCLDANQGRRSRETGGRRRADRSNPATNQTSASCKVGEIQPKPNPNEKCNTISSPTAEIFTEASRQLKHFMPVQCDEAYYVRNLCHSYLSRTSDLENSSRQMAPRITPLSQKKKPPVTYALRATPRRSTSGHKKTSPVLSNKRKTPASGPQHEHQGAPEEDRMEQIFGELEFFGTFIQIFIISHEGELPSE
ncbi:hypothetical protein PR048_032431 [Dryococelus australis]|uniref:Uncharacterized protein n=1 Tax=Dryococelus australis TaxID=614101 RepID=A0ABQ9G264_9NEOP|nr:hypothetical protein PR048_032431 [Dryococelus australis]